MKPILVATVLGSLSAGRVAAQAANVPVVSPGRLIGVFDERTGEPIEGVEVHICSTAYRTMNVNDYAGVELYAGRATLPVQYNVPDSGGGVLLLWTRER